MAPKRPPSKTFDQCGAFPDDLHFQGVIHGLTMAARAQIVKKGTLFPSQQPIRPVDSAAIKAEAGHTAPGAVRHPLLEDRSIRAEQKTEFVGGT